MAIWNRLWASASGISLGGPLGALIGAVAGQAMDRWRRARSADSAVSLRQVAFAIALIALAAKLAPAGAANGPDPLERFKKVFPIADAEDANLARLFNLANRDPRGFEAYAHQVAAIFATSPAALETLLDALFRIAVAAGTPRPSEVVYLHNVAGALGLGDETFRRIASNHARRDIRDPYALLGVRRGADDGEIRTAWLRLIREVHPDSLLAHGVPKELIEDANARMAAINAAYDTIRIERGQR